MYRCNRKKKIKRRIPVEQPLTNNCASTHEPIELFAIGCSCGVHTLFDCLFFSVILICTIETNASDSQAVEFHPMNVSKTVNAPIIVRSATHSEVFSESC